MIVWWNACRLLCARGEMRRSWAESQQWGVQWTRLLVWSEDWSLSRLIKGAICLLSFQRSIWTVTAQIVPFIRRDHDWSLDHMRSLVHWTPPLLWFCMHFINVMFVCFKRELPFSSCIKCFRCATGACALGHIYTVMLTLWLYTRVR